MRNPKVEPFTDSVGYWRWRVRGTDGSVLAESKPYATKNGLCQGLRAVSRLFQKPNTVPDAYELMGDMK